MLFYSLMLHLTDYMFIHYGSEYVISHIYITDIVYSLCSFGCNFVVL